MQYLIVVILLRIGIAVHAAKQIIDSEVGHQDYGEGKDHIAMEYPWTLETGQTVTVERDAVK